MQVNKNVSVERSFDGFTITVSVNAKFNTAGDGYWSDKAKEVLVTKLCMYIADDEEDGSGDLGIYYSTATWDDAADGLIYTDSAFIRGVRDFLIAQGFDNNAVNAIEYSEQGMQDTGRVSCDAYEFAAYMRKEVATA